MNILPLFVSYRCIKTSPTKECFLSIFFNLLLLFYIYFYLLDGYKKRKRSIEQYSETQRNIHMFLHFIGIIGLTKNYQKYVYSRLS